MKRAESNGLFRDIVEIRTPDSIRITHLLQNGDLLGALNHMKINKSVEQTALLLLAQYHDLKERDARKIIDNRDYMVQYNRISDTILETLKSDY